MYVCCLYLVHFVYIFSRSSVVYVLSTVSVSFMACLLCLYLGHLLYLCLPSASSIARLLCLCLIRVFCSLFVIFVSEFFALTVFFVVRLLFVPHPFYLRLLWFVCYTYALSASSATCLLFLCLGRLRRLCSLWLVYYLYLVRSIYIFCDSSAINILFMSPSAILILVPSLLTFSPRSAIPVPCSFISFASAVHYKSQQDIYVK